MPSRSIYRGAKRKLVLSFDVGIRHSGISYRYAYKTSLLIRSAYDGRLSDPLHDNSILDPRHISEVKCITRLVHKGCASS